jgi:putative endopeptidase
MGLLSISTILSVGTGCKPEKKEVQAISPSNIDTTVKAGDDFYAYANGNWLKNNPIPAEYSRFGAFEALEEENYIQLQDIMKEASADKNAKNGSINQKIRDFYNSGMDTLKIEKAGITPLKADLEKIDKIASSSEFMSWIIGQHACGSAPLFYFFGAQDEKNSNMVIAQIYQGGLGLPDRDYYLSDDPRSKEIRANTVSTWQKCWNLPARQKIRQNRMLTR